MKPLIIFGTGKIADVAYHHFVRDSDYQVVAFSCDAAWLPPDGGPESTHYDLPLLPFEEIERHFPPASFAIFVAVGYQELNALRVRKCEQARAKGYRLASYVSPRADHGPWLEIGDNCLILDGVGIQPGVRIGHDVFVWNNTLIGHHSVVHDHCWLAAGATLGGCVVVGERCFVGLNATVGGELTIGADSFLGAAALVLKNAAPRSVFITAGCERFRLESDAFLRMTRMPALASGATRG